MYIFSSINFASLLSRVKGKLTSRQSGECVLSSLTFHQLEPIKVVEVRHKERRFKICSKTFDVMVVRPVNAKSASDSLSD